MIRLLTLVFAFTALTALTAISVNAGLAVQETDTEDYVLLGVFDLRNGETFVQVTNTSSSANNVHIQIYNVANNCNENNFFDAYTPADTHVYNLRDITTNDGNPSGVVLPPDAYGVFVAFFDNDPLDNVGVGNIRIQNENGFEYRTNLIGVGVQEFGAPEDDYTVNYNTEAGIVFSDVFGFGVDLNNSTQEAILADITEYWVSFDIDIYNLDEVPFSCRNVIFACTDQDNPLLPALLEDAADQNAPASVASFEYGINEALPSSNDAPQLCPNNVISEGFVRLDNIDYSGVDEIFVLFIGLNNGNSRGSMDSLWYDNGPIAP